MKVCTCEHGIAVAQGAAIHPKSDRNIKKSHYPNHLYLGHW